MGQTVTTEKLTYNFSGHFSGAGTYQFRVRAVRGEYDEGSWAESDERTVSDEEAARIRSQASSTSHGYAAVDPAGTWLWQPGSRLVVVQSQPQLSLLRMGDDRWEVVLLQ